jgi:hypothetical protein
MENLRFFVMFRAMEVACSCVNTLSFLGNFLITWSLMLRSQQALISTCITDIKRAAFHVFSHWLLNRNGQVEHVGGLHVIQQQIYQCTILFICYCTKAAKVWTL